MRLPALYTARYAAVRQQLLGRVVPVRVGPALPIVQIYYALEEVGRA